MILSDPSFEKFHCQECYSLYWKLEAYNSISLILHSSPTCTSCFCVSDIQDFIIVPVFFGMEIFLAFLGNGLVVYVMLMFGESNTTNCYIVNLALTDLVSLFTQINYYCLMRIICTENLYWIRC